MARAGARKGQTNPTRETSAGTTASEAAATQPTLQDHQVEELKTDVGAEIQEPTSGAPLADELAEAVAPPQSAAEANSPPAPESPPAARLTAETVIEPEPSAASEPKGDDRLFPPKDDEPPRPAQAAPAPIVTMPPRWRRKTLALGLVAGLVGGALVFGIADFILRQGDMRVVDLDVRQKGMAQQIAELQRQTANLPPDLRDAVAALEHGLNGVAATVATLPTSQPDVGPLETNLATLQQTVQGLNDRVAGIESRLEGIQKFVQRGSALQLAVEDAAKALRQGGSLAQPATRLKGLAADDQALNAAADALAQAESKGIAPIATLSQQLSAIQPTASGQSEASDGGWFGSVTANVSKLVDIKGIDEQNDAIRAAVDTARERLAGGDLAGARDAMAPLARDQVAGAPAWVESAENRLQAEQAIANARQRVDEIVGAMR